MRKALDGQDYDRQWAKLGGFIIYNPGARHRRRLIAEMLHEVPCSSVLDVGCGPGELLLYLRELMPGVRAWAGADFAAKTVIRTRENLPWAEIQTLDITAGVLPHRYDLVICSEVIEHLEDQQGAFANLSDMVSPGGHLLISCPAGRVFETEQRFGHLHHPTPAEMEDFGRRTGLRTVRSLVWGWPAYYFVKCAANVNPEYSLRAYGTGQYGFIKKAINALLYCASFLSWPSSRGCQLFWLYRKPKPHEPPRNSGLPS